MAFPLKTNLSPVVGPGSPTSPTSPGTPRRKLPSVPLLSTRHLFGGDGKDFSCFALSPLSGQVTATEPSPITSAAPLGWTPLRTNATPLTAIRLPPIYTRTPLSPVVATPASAASQSSNMSLLDRYLIEAERQSNVGTPINSPDELNKSALTRDVPDTAIYRPYVPPAASEADTASEIFSPILGEGPAEMFALEDLRDKLLWSPEPSSPTGSDETFIEDDTSAAVSEHGEAQALSAAEVPLPTSEDDLNELPSYEEAVAQEPPALQTEVQQAGPLEPAMIPTTSDIVEEVAAQHINKLSQPISIAPKAAASKRPTEIKSPGYNTANFGEAPPSAPTKDSFDALPEVELDTRLSPHFDPPPAPMAKTFAMGFPTFIGTNGPSPYDPPPAPKLSEFPLEFPPSPKHAGPAPIDTSGHIEEWRRLTISGTPSGFADSPIVPDSHFFSIASPLSPPPAPGPMSLKFDVELPPSPLRSKPAPIDTSREFTRSAETTPQPQRSAPLGSATMSSGEPTPRSIGQVPPSSKQTTFFITAPGREAKTVRFNLSDAYKSPLPSSTFKIPVSPGIPNFSRHIPHESEFEMPEELPGPVRPPLRKYSSAAVDALTDLPSSREAGRETRSLFRRISPTFGRFAKRSQSEGRGVLNRRDSEPQTPSVVQQALSDRASSEDVPVQDEQTSNGIPILPNTAYDPKTKQFFVTKNQVKSEKYIILQTYFKPNQNKRKELGLNALNTLVEPVSTSSSSRPESGQVSALPKSAESAGSNDWWG